MLIGPELEGDRGRLVVKVTDSWPAYREFEPSTAEDPPCIGGRCTLNVSRLKRPPVGVVRKLGEGNANSEPKRDALESDLAIILAKDEFERLAARAKDCPVEMKTQGSQRDESR
ncbi:hypothetical protein TNCV_3330611 [Trichonephila clavipes]|nr:hypothetical protein TNCV_3330611 [Trichonephila clavipes]